jgi:hypothetical protein
MPTPTGFQQAKLVIEGSGPLTCWFNPNEYSISKTNEWTIQPIVGSSLPTAQFGGGQSRTLSLDLLFHADPDGDVTPVTDRLFAMMEVDSSLAAGNRNQARPPTLTFSWGTYTSFDAVCRSLSVQFTLFRPDGTPIRAQARLELVQVAKDPSTPHGTPAAPQNPTTRAVERLRAHVVCDGDSLQSIAYRHYGDATRWRVIAETNGIDDPTRLTRGARLAVPLLET